MHYYAFESESEVVISFIDVGNHGTQTVDILVSHSTRSKDHFVCLVPTFNFMSVAESKQAINVRKVQMFKTGDMLNESKSQTWDRLKLVCRQSYSNGKQFRLSFVSGLPQLFPDQQQQQQQQQQRQQQQQQRQQKEQQQLPCIIFRIKRKSFLSF